MATTRLDQLTTFLAASPNDAFLLFAIAKEHEGSGDETQAQFFYEKLASEHENYVGTYYHLGKLYERQDKIAQAIATYQKGMDVAKAQGERHALGELATAKSMIDDEY